MKTGQSSESRFLNPLPPRLLALPPAFHALESDLCRHGGDTAATRTKTQSNETRPGLPGSKAQGQYQRLGPCIFPGRRLSLTTPLPLGVRARDRREDGRRVEGERPLSESDD